MREGKRVGKRFGRGRRRDGWHLAMVAVILIAVVLVGGCATTGPGKRDIILISTQDEVAIGREVAAEVESEERVLDDPVVSEYLSRLGNRIVQVSDRPTLAYSFKALASDEINAFAVPGGFIYVYTGLMKELDNEAQLAAVIGHEVAHIVARHSVKKLQQIYGYALLLELAGGSDLSPAARAIADVGATLVLQGYSRDNEFEADEYGTLYAYHAGYTPNGMLQLLGKFQELDTRRHSFIEQLLASHPPTPDRIERVEDEIATFPREATALPEHAPRYAEVKARLP
jgi:predicted Zn-dependent protease